MAPGGVGSGPGTRPKLDKDRHSTKILNLSKASNSGRGPALEKTYLRSDEQGIVRTKTAEEVRRALQSS